MCLDEQAESCCVDQCGQRGRGSTVKTGQSADVARGRRWWAAGVSLLTVCTQERPSPWVSHLLEKKKPTLPVVPRFRVLCVYRWTASRWSVWPITGSEAAECTLWQGAASLAACGAEYTRVLKPVETPNVWSHSTTWLVSHNLYWCVWPRRADPSAKISLLCSTKLEKRVF